MFRIKFRTFRYYMRVSIIRTKSCMFNINFDNLVNACLKG